MTIKKEEEKEGDLIEVVAIPITEATTEATKTPSSPSTPTVSSSSPESKVTITYQTTPPPPGVESGGVWGKQRYVGYTTGAATLVAFLCCLLPGLLVLCCPMDERDAYMVNGKVYLADGDYAGPANSKFTPSGTASNHILGL